MNKCKIAVVGVGQRGCHYAEMLSKHQQVELTALCDNSPPRLDAFAEDFPETRWFKATIYEYTEKQRTEIAQLLTE